MEARRGRRDTTGEERVRKTQGRGRRGKTRERSGVKGEGQGMEQEGEESEPENVRGREKGRGTVHGRRYRLPTNKPTVIILHILQFCFDGLESW